MPGGQEGALEKGLAEWIGIEEERAMGRVGGVKVFGIAGDPG